VTLRSVLIGCILALCIATLTYFNDHVIRQTMLIGNHFPVAVFGPFLLLLLLLNPLLVRVRQRALARMEIAVIVAMGLAVCGWPGSSFFRVFSSLISVPPNYEQTMTSWKATRVMSYVPGASPMIAEGHVKDWAGFSRALATDSSKGDATVAGRMWSRLPQNVHDIAVQVSASGEADPTQRSLLLNAVDEVIADPTFYTPSMAGVLPASDKTVQRLLAKVTARTASEREGQKLNRAVVDRSFPQFIVDAPKGDGILLANGDPQSPAVQTLLQGTGGKKHIGLGEMYWDVWWPSLKFWGGLAILLGLASVCIIVVVQPQWKRELLPYPIAKFVEEVARPHTRGSLPAVMSDKMFWVAFGSIMALHLCNGLNAWFPTIWFVKIPLTFDFAALQQLFPNATRAEASQFLITAPALFPTVVAFAFFLATEVSFSVGFSGVLFLMLFVVMSASGYPFEKDFLEPKNISMLRFGAYLGTAAMLFFLGRRYYLNVIGSSFGLRRNEDTPRNAVWAARICIVCLAGCVAILTQAGVDWVLGAMLVSLIMLTFFVMTRINAETGTFFIQPVWGVVGVITALFGMQAIGPTAYIVMALVCTLFVLDPRECVMPFIANGLYMGTAKAKKAAPNGLISVVAIMVVVGLAATIISGLYMQYNNGIDSQDVWATSVNNIPGYSFRYLAGHITDLSAYNELNASLSVSALGHFTSMRPDMLMIKWAIAGVALVLACNFMRLRFSWWPLHPVAFIVWGTYPGFRFAFSFLIGWLIKVAVVKFAGAKGYRTVLPLMIGLIAGELCSALGWAVAGAIFFMVTGKIPESYQIFPG